jgi:hypothetical protein
VDSALSGDQVLELIDGGLVYRNPKPHLKAVHAGEFSMIL